MNNERDPTPCHLIRVMKCRAMRIVFTSSLAPSGVSAVRELEAYLSPAGVYLWPSATSAQRAVFTFGRVRLVRNVPCAFVFTSGRPSPCVSAVRVLCAFEPSLCLPPVGRHRACPLCPVRVLRCVLC